MHSSKSQKAAVYGILGALALALSACETFLLPELVFLPPGAKPGLSNIVTLFSSYIFGIPATMLVVLIKAVFALITRGFTAFLMSLAGGLLSALAMLLLIRLTKEKFSQIGIGIIGACFHNIGQLGVSFIYTGTKAVFSYAPVLLLCSLITGFLTGTIVKTVMPPVREAAKKNS